MKKIITLALVALMLVMVFTGCNSVSATREIVYTDTLRGVSVANMDWYQEVDTNTYKIHCSGTINMTNNSDIPIRICTVRDGVITYDDTAFSANVVYTYEYTFITDFETLLKAKSLDLPFVDVMPYAYDDALTPIIIDINSNAKPGITNEDLKKAEEMLIFKARSHTWDSSAVIFEQGFEVSDLTICREISIKTSETTYKFYFDVVGTSAMVE